jgi:hypothetical protein
MRSLSSGTHPPEGVTLMNDLAKDCAALVLLTLLGTLAAVGWLSVGFGLVR